MGRGKQQAVLLLLRQVKFLGLEVVFVFMRVQLFECQDCDSRFWVSYGREINPDDWDACPVSGCSFEEELPEKVEEIEIEGVKIEDIKRWTSGFT